MGGEWIETTVGEFCPFQYGKGLPERNRVPGPYLVFGSNGVVGSHLQPLVDGPGIIIGHKGAVGAVHYSKRPFWPINTTFYVVPDDHRDLRFTYYLLGALGLDRMNSDSAVPGLNRGAAHARRILVPPLSEQRAIARILGALDDKIELNRRMNEKLEAMAEALFKSWFVDFDPVVVNALKAGNPIPEKFAKRAAHYRDNPDRLGLPENILRLSPARFVDSELGPIPEGWEVKALSEAIEINPQRPLTKGTIAPYLDMANMPTKGHRPNAVRMRAFTSGSKFVNGDTLLARITPCLENGKTSFVDFLDDGQVGWGSTEFFVMRPRDPIPPIYGYLLARSSEFREYAIQSMTGSSGRQRVQLSAIQNYPVLTPATDTLRCFADHIEALFSRIKTLWEESRTLAALRDMLLPKLISGELRVPGVEKILEDVT